MNVNLLGSTATDVTIRAVSNEDLRVCAAMMASSSPWSDFRYSEAECLGKLDIEKLDIKVVIVNQVVVGFIAVQLHGLSSSPMLSLICIRSDMRNLGLGTHLISIVEEEIFRAEKNLFLTVSDFNADAIRLYERLGYTRCGEVTNYNFHGVSELIMRKTTGPRRESMRNTS